MNSLSRSGLTLVVVILSLFAVHGKSADVCDYDESVEIIQKTLASVTNETSIALGLFDGSLQSSFTNGTHYTILVPTNEAFDELAKANGLAEEEDLKIPPPVLRFHVIEGIALFGAIETPDKSTVESGETFDTLLADTKIELRFELKEGVEAADVKSLDDVTTHFLGPYNSAEMVTTFGYDLIEDNGLDSDCVMPVSILLIDHVLIPPNSEDESPTPDPDAGFDAGSTSPGGSGSAGDCYKENYLAGSITCVAGCGLTPGPSCNNVVCASGCPDPSSVGMSTLGAGESSTSSSSSSEAEGYSHMPSDATMPQTLVPSESSGSGYGINCAFGPCGGPTVGAIGGPTVGAIGGPTVGKISVPNTSGCASGPCVGKLATKHSYGSSRSVSTSKCLANNSPCQKGPRNGCCSGICERPNGSVQKYNCLDY